MLGLVAACGHAEFDLAPDVRDGGLLDAAPPAGGPTTPIDTPPPPDMPTPTKACATWGAFAKPTKLSAVSTTDEDWRPQVTVDGLTLYISYHEVTGEKLANIMQANRATTTSSFSPPTRAPGLPSPTCMPNTAGGAQLSPDGTLLVYHCHVKGSTSTNYDEIFIAPRNSNGAFGASLRLTTSDLVSDIYPAISADGLRLYFSNDDPKDGGDLDIYLSQRASTADAFPTPTKLSAAINSNGPEWMLIENRSGTEAFFTKGNDIYRMTRNTVQNAWGSPAIVPELNTPGIDYPGSLSFDGSTLYLNHGGDDIWQAIRPCLVPKD